MSLAIVLVHYHAPAWLARAVAALRADPGGAGAELIVVDNGSDAAARSAIAALPARLLDAGGNRGYAGGVNLGVSATRASRIVVMNPDVEVAAGCLAALLAVLDGGAAAAGPRFTWDAGHELLLPPAERREPLEHVLRRAGPLHRLARARWRRHARRHWLATGPLPSHALSGALLAFRRDAWEAVGPFDERFQLYFEETEWLLRLQRRGLPAAYVPAATAVHHYNQSAAHEPRAAGWFAESQARFETLAYPGWLRALVARLPSARRAGEAQASPGTELELPDGVRWIEVTPLPQGYPAAGVRIAPGTRRWRFPETVRAQLAPGTYHMTALDGSDRAVAACAFGEA